MWGTCPYTPGQGAQLLERGWLTLHATLGALSCTEAELGAAVRAGAIRSRAVGCGVRLYRITELP